MSKKVTNKKREELITKFITLIIFTAFCIFAYLRQGIIGIFLSNLGNYIFGIYAYIIFGIIIVYSLIVLIFNKYNIKKRTFIALILILIAILIYTSIPSMEDMVGLDIFNKYIENTPLYFKEEVIISFFGGLIGSLLISLTSYLFGKTGSLVIVVALGLIALVLILSLPIFKTISEKLAWFFRLPAKIFDFEDDGEVEVKKEKEVVSKPSVNKIEKIVLDDQTSTPMLGKFDDIIETGNVVEPTITTPTVEPIKKEEIRDIQSEINKDLNTVNEGYILPDFSLLDPIVHSEKSNRNSLNAKEKAQRLLEILRNFGIDASLIATHIGPSVTQFEIKIESNVKVSKVLGIQDNIKMELAAKDIRIEAPIPGRNAVGIEIPNEVSTPVKMKEVISKLPKEMVKKPLMLALGKDLLGNVVFCQLDKMPHLLIAGATGSGKSVCMNTIITSILLRCKPDDVKLLLIDPKKVEFTPYSKIPHLIGPVINDAAEANNALKVMVQIMEDRYDVFAANAVRNIEGYNQKVLNEKDNPRLIHMSYIVVIIDELADLMAVSGKEVELSIQRLTQLARAAGIHLIVATQRPSTDVITGIIKANIPSRIAFSVSSGIDSRTILDHVGAERLLGNGDMLYLPNGVNNAIRLQGVFVTDEEVRRICEFTSSQKKPLYDDSFIRLDSVMNNTEGGISISEDPLYDEVKEYVIEAQKASTSLLQRKFGIGYNRAARLIDVLEQNGIIGPVQGSKPRDVYVKKEENDE